jgi:hypothetical protein
MERGNDRTSTIDEDDTMPATISQREAEIWFVSSIRSIYGLSGLLGSTNERDKTDLRTR